MIEGSDRAGWVLDKHMLSSTYLGGDAYGHLGERLAGEAAPGYLRVFPRAINQTSRRPTDQIKAYTYPQPTISTSASTPGSIFGRHVAQI